MTAASHKLYPPNTSEMVALIRQAVVDETQLRLRGVLPGDLSEREGVRDVFLDQMADVVDYPARDMTITVEAGMPLLELRRILATENQQLPIDAVADFASIGSLVAGDISGSRQYGYGTLRDYVIGIEGVDGSGRVFHAGGRVVKNVAGYDLCRLMVGSRGMLGAITQVTFKLKPIPECSLFRSFRFNDAAKFEQALERLNTSDATPILLDFSYTGTRQNSAGTTESGHTDEPDPVQTGYFIHAGVEGTEQTCRWQVDRLIEECDDGEEIHFDGQDGWSIEQHCRSSAHGWDAVALRVRPSQLASVAADLVVQGYNSSGHAGSGILFVANGADAKTTRRVCEGVGRTYDAAVSQWDVDHPASATDPLTTRLRQTFDPKSVFVQ